MDYDFLVAAPHRREAICNWGASMFDGTAERLVDQLTIPMVPPGFGLPTFVGRKAAKFNDTNNTNAKVSRQESQEEDQLAKCTSDLKRSRETLLDEEVPGERDGKYRKPQSDDALHTPIITKAPVTFSSLPTEVHDLIFMQLRMRDVFFLGLTSQYFWDMARTLIGNFYASFMGTWAGESIIGIGDDLGLMDLPPGMLTKEEEEELQSGLNVDEFDPGNFGSDLFKLKDLLEKPGNLYRMALTRYDKIRPDGRIYPTLLKEACRYGFARLPEGALFAMDPEPWTFYPKSRSWILRNLTTQEYVRSESISRGEASDGGPHIGRPGFGQAVLSRICWSTTSEIGETHRHRGVWAGHSFDIVTLDRFQQEKGLGDKEWKDVSEEVANEIFKDRGALDG